MRQPPEQARQTTYRMALFHCIFFFTNLVLHGLPITQVAMYYINTRITKITTIALNPMKELQLCSENCLQQNN